MATVPEVMSALQKAHDAGNVEHARELASLARQLLAEEKEPVGPVIQGAYGVNKILADLYEAPGEVLGGVTRSLRSMRSGADVGPSKREQFLKENPDPISEFLRRSQPPQNMGERIGRRVGEELGAGLPLAAVPYALAGRATQYVGPQAMNAAQRATAALLEGIKRAPLKAALGETVATVGAGLGAGAAREVFPGDPTAEMAGQLVGGIVPSVGLTPQGIVARQALKYGARAVKQFSPAMRKQAAEEEVSKALGGILTPESQAALQKADELRKAIPGFNPSLGEATGLPSLTATQRKIEGAAGGAELDRFARRRTSSEQAVDEFGRGQAPEGEGGAEFVIDAARGRVTGLSQRVAAEEAALTTRRKDLAGQLPEADRVQIGTTIRGRMAELRTQTQADMKKLSDELGLSDVDLTVPFGRFRQQLLDEFNPKSIFSDTANQPDVLKVMREMELGGSPSPVFDKEGAITGFREETNVTFKDVKALRERLSDDLIDAIGSANPSRQKVRQLTAMKSRVDDFINKDLDAASPGLADNWKQFRQTYLKEYVERFEKGAAFKANAKDGRAFYRTPEEAAAEHFFSPGDESGALQFKALFRGDPEAGAALRSHALDSLRDAAIRDGEIVPAKYAEWVRKHASVLKHYPEIATDVSKIDGATQALSARSAVLEARGARIEDSFLAKELSRVEAGARSPEQAIGNALKNPREMLQLTNSLRDKPEAMAALRRHVWDGAQSMGPADLDKYILANEKSLRMVLTPEHLGDLRRIQAARAMHENVPAPTGQAVDVNPLAAMEKTIGMGMPQIASRIYASKRQGGPSTRYLVTEAFGRFMRATTINQQERLMKDVLYNPETARDLATMAFARGPQPDKISRLNTRLFNLGAPFMDEENQDGR